jgi:transglutaminase superfamily protein
MRRPRSERFLLGVLAISSLLCLWQLALFTVDSSFVDGICAVVARPESPPEQRAMQLFRWVNSYDDEELSSSAATPPRGLLTPRAMIEHRAYFRANCGSKAWLLAILARHAGLQARELRLCDARHEARHVVCEVLIGSRWLVLDPTVDLDFRRRDGQLATAAELRDPALLAVNARRADYYDLQRWQFTHAERLHFEKVPLVGGLLRRLAARLSGRPAEELTIPPALEQPRLVAAGSLALLALLALAATVLLARRRGRATQRLVQHDRVPVRAFALNTDQD